MTKISFVVRLIPETNAIRLSPSGEPGDAGGAGGPGRVGAAGVSG